MGGGGPEACLGLTPLAGMLGAAPSKRAVSFAGQAGRSTLFVLSARAQCSLRARARGHSADLLHDRHHVHHSPVLIAALGIAALGIAALWTSQRLSSYSRRRGLMRRSDPAPNSFRARLQHRPPAPFACALFALTLYGLAAQGARFARKSAGSAVNAHHAVQPLQPGRMGRVSLLEGRTERGLHEPFLISL